MERVDLPGGWDCVVTLVDGAWVERTPRREHEVMALRLLTEARLMAWLGPQLPMTVSQPVVVQRDPVIVRYPYITGAEASTLEPAEGIRLGKTLRVLHDADPHQAVALGIPDAVETRTAWQLNLESLSNAVIALLPGRLHRPSHQLVRRLSDAPFDNVAHTDIGGWNVLAEHGHITGIIDWTDTRIFDRAIDLAWGLWAMPQPFADELARTYGVTADIRARAHDWYTLEPWFGVRHALHNDDRRALATGLTHVRERLENRT